MPELKFLQRWGEEFVADHDGLNPWGWMWQVSDRWDRARANREELAAREFDVDQIRRANKLNRSENYAAAFQIWSELAERGSVWSMIEVGRSYEFGGGVPIDLAKAEDWYKRAFAGGSRIAMLKCAKFAASRGDYSSCDALLQVGVDQDWVSAIFWQAWYRHKNSESPETYRIIYPMLKDAAKREHPAARMILANFMLRGKFGVLKVPLGWLKYLRATYELSNAS